MKRYKSFFQIISVGMLASCLCMGTLSSCNDDDDPVAIPENWVTIDNTTLHADYHGGTITSNYQLSNGLNTSTVYVINQESWCSGYIKDGILTFDIEKSLIPEERTAISYLMYDENHRVELKVIQGKAPETPVSDIQVSDDLPENIMIDQSIDLAPYFTALPNNASYKTFTFSVNDATLADITPEGVLTGRKGGDVEVTITARDEAAFSKTVTIHIESKSLYQPTGWTVKTSVDYGYCPDGKTGMPLDIFDDKLDTYLSLVKPGKTLNGCTTPADHTLSFTIDCLEEMKFNYIYIGWRSTNKYDYLRLWGLKLYGSHNGTDFEPIGEEITTNRNNNVNYETANATYRYVKVEYTDFSTASGSSVQIAEFRLGLDYERTE